LFRGHELTTGLRCTEDTMNDALDVRSVLSLCEREWKKSTIAITPNSKTRTGPSLRFACGELLLVDKDNVVRGAPFGLITLYLRRVGAVIDCDVEACVNTVMAEQTEFNILE
jgi:hypothetical protein